MANYNSIHPSQVLRRSALTSLLPNMAARKFIKSNVYELRYDLKVANLLSHVLYMHSAQGGGELC